MALHVLLETDFEEGEEFIALFGGQLHSGVLWGGNRGILLQSSRGYRVSERRFNVKQKIQHTGTEKSQTGQENRAWRLEILTVGDGVA